LRAENRQKESRTTAVPALLAVSEDQKQQIFTTALEVSQKKKMGRFAPKGSKGKKKRGREDSFSGDRKKLDAEALYLAQPLVCESACHLGLRSKLVVRVIGS